MYGALFGCVISHQEYKSSCVLNGGFGWLSIFGGRIRSHGPNREFSTEHIFPETPIKDNEGFIAKIK